MRTAGRRFLRKQDCTLNVALTTRSMHLCICSCICRCICDAWSRPAGCRACTLDHKPQTLNPKPYSLNLETLQDAVPEEARQEDLMKEIAKGNFTLRILREQLQNIQKMGPMNQVMSMIPGLSNSGLFSGVRIFKQSCAGMRRVKCECAWQTCWPHSGQAHTRTILTLLAEH